MNSSAMVAICLGGPRRDDLVPRPDGGSSWGRAARWALLAALWVGVGCDDGTLRSREAAPDASTTDGMDAAVVGPRLDAAPVGPRLDGAPIDTGIILPDAAVIRPDAAVLRPDAAVPDAAVVLPDAAVVLPDAAVIVLDAAVIRPDAAPVDPDAAVAPPDAAPVDRDAAPVDPDAAPVDPDAAPVDLDAAPADPDAAPEIVLPACPEYVGPQQLGNLGAPAVDEASGIVESHRNPGVLWTHNDSDGGNRIFALDVTGAPLAIFEIDGAEQTDWEDLAVGPGPDPALSYVYVGDVGDNNSNRLNIQIRRFAEPEVMPVEPPPTIQLEGVETFTLVYPDGPHNSGTLMVDPRGGDVYVVAASDDGRSGVYRAPAPLAAEGEIELEHVANLRFGVAPLPGDAATTGGDISPAGDAILIRTPNSAFLWRRAPDMSVAEALATEPCPLPLAQEGQGEAIGFAADGVGYFTTSEGLNAPVYFFGPPGVDRAPPEPDAGAPAEPQDAAVEPPDMAPVPVDMAPVDPPVPGECPRFADPVVTGNLQNGDIIEASGVAESRRNPGVLWVHNDAGGTNRVFALRTNGEHLGVFLLDGPRPRDWEDLSVGPGPEPDRSYVYVADVGDNAIQRGSVRLRRFPEPAVPPGGLAADVQLEGVEDFTMVYPDGPHNCESMMVDPRNGDVYLVTKSGDGISPVFRAAAPLSNEGDIQLERVANLVFGEAPLGGNRSTTGGDISPTGDGILIRTYSAVFYWRRGPDASIAEALRTPPCPMPRPQDRQGEAIGFAADGRGYYTVSEGAGTPVHYHARR